MLRVLLFRWVFRLAKHGIVINRKPNQHLRHSQVDPIRQAKTAGYQPFTAFPVVLKQTTSGWQCHLHIPQFWEWKHSEMTVSVIVQAMICNVKRNFATTSELASQPRRTGSMFGLRTFTATWYSKGFPEDSKRLLKGFFAFLFLHAAWAQARETRKYASADPK